MFTAASDQELDEQWTSIMSMDEKLRKEDKLHVSAKHLSLKLANFMSHCCNQ